MSNLPQGTHRHGRRLLELIRPHRNLLVAVLVLALLGAGLSVLEPLVLKIFFDALDQGEGLRGPAKIAALILALGLLREISTGLSNWMTWKTRLRIHHSLLEATVGRLQTLPLEYHQKESVGGVMTKLDRGIQGLLSAMMELSFSAFPALVYLVLSLLVMAQLDWRLTLVVAVFTPVPGLLGVLAAPEQVTREKSLLDRWVRIYSRFNEVLSGIVTVKSFAMEDAEKKRFLDGVGEANGVVGRGVAVDSFYAGARSLVVTVARLAAIAVGGYLIVEHEITVGTVIAFLGYVSGLFGPVQGLTSVYQTIQKARISLDTLSEMLDAQDYLLDAPDAVTLPSIAGEVVFDAVSFGYGGARRVLHDVSLHAQAGQVIALVGKSGGGKSTLMALLQRLYDPAAGAITIDGIDLRRIQQRWLRRQIGVVPQEPLLFNDSIRHNIAYGRPDATMEDIVAAARAAHAHEFIIRLDHDYDAPTGERGGRLSAGQRQRISIARALLKDPRILILDEATSALDAESESLIQEALSTMVRGRTTFVIAHRLSTVVHADKICVLDSGRLAESGTHGELLRLNGVYADLVRRQLGGLLDAAAA